MSEKSYYMLTTEEGEQGLTTVEVSEEMQKWRDETKKVCSECSERLRNTKAIFEMIKGQVKNREDFNDIKQEYKKFSREIKNFLYTEENNSFDYMDTPPKKRRNREEIVHGFNEGNSNERINRAYDSFKSMYRNARIALRGGEYYDEDY